MTKQRRRKHQQTRTKQRQLSPCPFFPFTVDEITFLKKILVTFVREIETLCYPLPNVACALETTASMQEKFTYMLDHDEEKLLLDPNEVIILDGSLELWIVDALMLPSSLRDEQAIHTCLALKEKLAPALGMAMDALHRH